MLSVRDQSQHRSHPRRYAVGTAIALSLISALQGCTPLSQSDASQNQSLVITGSSTVAPLINEMGKQFEQAFPDTRIDVQTGGSSRGIADARSGIADIGMVSRSLKPEESDLQAYPIALDGIAIIVHRDNPITSLSDQQIKDIYTKKQTQWSAFGGNPNAITVVNKAEGRSTLELFEAYFKFDPKAIKADVIIGDNQQGIKTVAANPNAIGYVSIGSAQAEIKRGVPLKLLPLEGIDATMETVKNGSYPLSRTLNIVTKGSPDPLAQKFINYVTSDQVTSIVLDQEFIPKVKKG